MPGHLILTLVAAAGVIQVAVFGTTIYLHRSATHRALILHPAVEWAFKFSLWLTTGQMTKEWVDIMRASYEARTSELKASYWLVVEVAAGGSALLITLVTLLLEASRRREKSRSNEMFKILQGFMPRPKQKGGD